MSSTAPNVAPDVDVGERLRAIRQLRRCTLRTVAERARVSESFLSQVERGKSSASIASLRRIAGALGVNVADLFEPSGPPRPRVLRRSERPGLAFGVLGTKRLLTPRPLQHLEVFVGELAGSVRLELDTEVHELESGDSIDYRSSSAHRVTNVGTGIAEVMWVIS